MDINRRTVLLGLGAAGFGTTSVLVGSGAFSSAEAERTVAVNVTDDSDAVLSLKINPQVPELGDEILSTEDLDNGGPAVIKIEQDSLNQHATTLFEDVLRVTNDGAQDVGFSVDKSASDDPNNPPLVGDALDILKDGSTIVDSGSGNNAVNLPAGDHIDLTIVIDLRGSNADISTINTIAIAAREEDYQ